MLHQEIINRFSDYVFWDVDRDTIDLSENALYIVQRVLEYGQIGDWSLLLEYYGLEQIVLIARQ